MNILQINASARRATDAEGSVSTRLATELTAGLRAAHPGATVTVRDLTLTPQPVLDEAFPSRQDALDGFLGASVALHLVATVAVMADARDLQKAVGSGDGAWFASSDTRGRGTLRSADGSSAGPDALAQFIPTVFLYDAYPGGIGLSEPLFGRRGELVAQARTLVEACACRAGCPACIGPVLATDESRTTTPKQLALRVLSLLAPR